MRHLDPCEAAAEALRRPEHFAYYGDLDESDGWGRAFGVHRDSDVLEISNWETISADLAERFPDDWTSESSSHWAVGWVEEGRVRVLRDPDADIAEENLTEAFLAVLDWKERLDEYPVADEEDFSRREWEDFEETLTQCYDVPEEDVHYAAGYLFETHSVYHSDELTQDLAREARIMGRRARRTESRA